MPILGGTRKIIKKDNYNTKLKNLINKAAFPEFNLVVFTLSVSISRAQVPGLGERGKILIKSLQRK